METVYTPIGTCFGVAVRYAPPLTGAQAYIVTAKHVLLVTNDTYLSEVYLRVNSLNGFGYLRVNLNPTNGFKIYTHPDKEVDIAVIAGNPEPDEGWQTKCLDSKFIATKDTITNYSIREGDDMFFTGLFTPYYGSTHNVPICRFGKLSMLTDEKIPVAPGDSENLYIMEAQAFGGNSGSPTFFWFDGNRVPLPDNKLYLAGILKGYFKDWSEADIVTAKSGYYLHGNSGVALVTTAYYLVEILNCDELKSKRAETEKALLTKLQK